MGKSYSTYSIGAKNKTLPLHVHKKNNLYIKEDETYQDG